MAGTSVLKLKVDDKEYNSSLKQAQQGMQHLEQSLKDAGKSFTQVDKSVVNYVRGIGQMEAQSKTARGRISEMSNAFLELSLQYKNMSDEVKSGDVGKALAASLETLKQRVQEAKSQLDSATQSLSDNGEAGKGTSSVMEMLKDKFTVNIDAIKLFNIGLQAAEGALSVAKDAFFASEATVDEWGRVIDSSKSLYEGFLTALNTGDISGYLSRIDSIVQAARAAYNELDRLGTMKTIQAPQMSAQQTENERMRMMIQTGRYIAPVDGRRASMQNGQLLTPDQIKRIEQQLQNGMQKVVTLIGNEVEQTSKAIDAVYIRQAKELGMDLSEFRKGTSSMAEFDKRMKAYDDYQKWRNENYYTDNWGNRRVKEGNPFEEYKKWGTFRVDGERYNDLVRLIQQRDQQAGQAYSMQSQAYRTMNRAEGVTVSKLMRGETISGTTGGGSKGGKTITEEKDDFVEINGLINMAAERVSDLQKRIREAPTESMIIELRDQLKDAQAELDRLNGKEVKIQMETGTSIQNDAGISAYIASIKQQLETADYGTSLYNGLSAQLADMTTLQNLIGESLRLGLGTAMFDAADELGKDFWTRAMEGGVDNIDWQTIVDKINEARKAAGWDAISLDFESGSVNSKEKKEKDGLQDSKTMLNAISQLTSGLQSIGIEIPNEIQSVISVIQGVMQVIEAVNTIIGVTQISSLTANTIAMGALTSALWANTATSWIPFAGGGIVPHFAEGGLIGKAALGMTIPGNSFSGDNLRMPVVGGGMIGVNSGELILNRVQQGVLADALSEPPASIQGGNPYVSGENIFLGMNNYLRRAGYGELVTTKR